MQSCGDFKWQRRYLDDLIKAKKVQVWFDDEDGIQEVQSMEQIHAVGRPIAMGALGDGFMKSNELEAKVERLTQAMIFLRVVCCSLCCHGSWLFVEVECND